MTFSSLGYYPGCALRGSSNDYEQSLKACLGAFGVDLKEVEDWICCGATAAHSINQKLSIALPARNLALAESQGYHEVFAPCPMCSMQLIKAARSMEKDAALRREMAEIVELEAKGEAKVLNLIQIFQMVGTSALKEKVRKSMSELKAACYYGCLLLRPPDIVEFDDFEEPHSMEELVRALGASTVEWNYKTECCGAGMTMANEDTVLELSHRILADAAAHGANCVVVACPMCHVNLDMKQPAIEKSRGVRHNMAIYYLSDLVGLALGMPARELGIDRHFVVTP